MKYCCLWAVELVMLILLSGTVAASDDLKMEKFTEVNEQSVGG